MLWACVPLAGRPMTCDSPTFELKSAPPIRAARVPAMTPLPWPRRVPNSMISWPRPLSRTRAALVAIRVW